MKISYIILFVVSVYLCADWHYDTIDSIGDVGTISSNAMDSSGLLHVSYMDATNGNLKYAHWTGNLWEISTIDSIWAVGWNNSLALDSSDHPHISYYDDTNADLKYTYYDGIVWNTETVYSPDKIGGYNSLALDSDDHGHIAYSDDDERYLRYSYWNGYYWEHTLVDSSSHWVGYNLSIAIDNQNNPHIVYEDNTYDDLEYAKWDGTTWILETIDTNDAGNCDPSIAIDNFDNLHISYTGSSSSGNRELRYALWDGSEWYKDTIDSTAQYTGRESSITVNNLGYPYISYWNSSDWELCCAYWSGSDWQFEIPDTSGQVGKGSSISLDPHGNPHITYYDNTTEDLNYCWYDDPPPPFSLVSPEEGAILYEYPLCDWEDAPDYPSTKYDIWYSENPEFNPHEEINDLTVSEYQFSESELYIGVAYYWKVRAHDGYEETWSNETWPFFIVSINIGEHPGLVLPSLELLHTYPNPARGTYVASFNTPGETSISFEIYDVSGRMIVSSPQEIYVSGTHHIAFNDLASGVYICRMVSGTYSSTNRVVVID